LLKGEEVKLTIHLCVEDKPGVLMRVAGIVTAKGANIDALTVAADPERAGLARIAVVADVEPRLTGRVVSEMNRLVQVLSAIDVSNGEPSNSCAHGSERESSDFGLTRKPRVTTAK
jgi:acetolactate synthase small subunit